MRSVLRRFVFMAVAAMASAPSISASAAEGKSSSLSWVRLPGTEQCIATNALAQAVEERLGRKAFVSPSDAELSVEGRIEKRQGAGWHAVIIVRDAHGVTLGTRELERKEPSCEAMGAPLALMIALMIDPDGAMQPKPAPPPEPPPPPAAEPAPSPIPTPLAVVPPPPDADRPLPPKADPWRFEGGADLAVVSGLTPAIAPGAGVEAILYPPKIPIGFRGFATLFLPTDAKTDDARASFDMLLLGGGLCPTLRGRVNLMGCLGGQLGALRPNAKTPGMTMREQVSALLNALVELRLSVPITAPIMATVGVSAAAPLLRPSFEYTRVDGSKADLHKVSAIALGADAGLGFYFP